MHKLILGRNFRLSVQSNNPKFIVLLHSAVFCLEKLDPIFQPVRYKTNNERKFFSLPPAFSRVSGSLLASFCRFVSCVRFSSIDTLVFLHRSAIEITLVYLSPSRFASQHQMLVPRRARNKIHWRFHCPFGPIPVLHILILAFLFRFFFL